MDDHDVVWHPFLKQYVLLQENEILLQANVGTIKRYSLKLLPKSEVQFLPYE